MWDEFDGSALDPSARSPDEVCVSCCRKKRPLLLECSEQHHRALEPLLCYHRLHEFAPRLGSESQACGERQRGGQIQAQLQSASSLMRLRSPLDE